MRDYLTTRGNKTGQMRLYTNVPRNKAAPSCKRVSMTHRILSTAHLRIVVHPQNNSFLCSPVRMGTVLGSVRVTGRLGTSKIMFNYLATRKRVSLAVVRRLVGTTRKLSIAFRETFSIYHSPGGTLRRVVTLNYGHVLASNRRPATRSNVPLLGRLRRRTTKEVVLLTKYNIGRGGVRQVTSRAKVQRFRFSTHRGVGDKVGCGGRSMSVNNAMRVSRCRQGMAATQEIVSAVRTAGGR